MSAHLAKIPFVSRLSSKIIRILGCNPGPMTLQGTNTYLLGTGEKRILVDTGDENVPTYINNLRSVLKEEQAQISTVILTHWHHDHIGGVKDVLKLNKSDNACQVWKYPRNDAPDIYDEIPSHIKVDLLENGQIINVEGASIKIVHTPGHTTDHIVLALDDGSLFSGDCILGEGTAVFEDLYDYLKSLHRILEINPQTIYPGHGSVIIDPIPKIQYYIEHRNQREIQILQVFQENKTKSFNELDIVKIVYKETPKQLWPAAAFNVNHHLRKLAKDEVLEENERNGENCWIYNSSNKTCSL